MRITTPFDGETTADINRRELERALRAGYERRGYVFIDAQGRIADRETMSDAEARRRNMHAEHFAAARPDASTLRWRLAP